MVSHLARATAALVLAGLALALPSWAPSAHAQTTGTLATIAPALKSDVIVTGPLVRIGDLVDNAGALADVPIFRSPEPGTTGRVPVEVVAEAVHVHQLVGLVRRGLSVVTVTRVGRTISADEIKDRLADVLARQYAIGNDDNLDFAFDNALLPLHVESSVQSALRITRATYDRGSGRFDVTFDVPGSTVVALPLRVTGRVTETAPVVVMQRPVERGTTLRPQDVAIERRPRIEVGSNAVTNLEAAIGMAARRTLRADTTLRSTDLVKPILVRRNEPVTIVYQTPGILLTVRGKALEDGAKGDLIDVANVQSARNVQAYVVGSGRVAVHAVTAVATRLAATESQVNPQTKQ